MLRRAGFSLNLNGGRALDAVLFERRPQGVRKPHVFERFNGRGNRFTLRNDVPVVAVVIE